MWVVAKIKIRVTNKGLSANQSAAVVPFPESWIRTLQVSSKSTPKKACAVAKCNAINSGLNSVKTVIPPSRICMPNKTQDTKSIFLRPLLWPGRRNTQIVTATTRQDTISANNLWEYSMIT